MTRFDLLDLFLMLIRALVGLFPWLWPWVRAAVMLLQLGYRFLRWLLRDRD